MGPPLMGRKLATVFAVMKGPLELGPVGLGEGIPGMTGGVVTRPLSTIPSSKGLRGAPSMGIYGEVNKVGSD